MEHFEGFPPEAIVFLDDLAMNNNRAWFEDNRDTYADKLIEPARAFVVEFGAAMSKHRPALVADPRIDGSIFRMHRDVRFSKNKAPYKTNLAFFFWEGGKKKTSPGFYLHLSPTELYAGAGQYYFDKPELKKYREAVAEEGPGGQLAQIAADLEAAGYELRGEALKRLPRGFDPEHPRGELLKRKGIFTTAMEGIPDERISSPEFVDELVAALEPLLPLHDWLVRYAV